MSYCECIPIGHGIRNSTSPINFVNFMSHDTCTNTGELIKIVMYSFLCVHCLKFISLFTNYLSSLKSVQVCLVSLQVACCEHCVDKYIKMSQRVTLRVQEHFTIQQGASAK